MKEGGYFGYHKGRGEEMGERLIYLYFVDSSSLTVGRQERHVLFVGAPCNLVLTECSL